MNEQASAKEIEAIRVSVRALGACLFISLGQIHNVEVSKFHVIHFAKDATPYSTDSLTMNDTSDP